MLLILFSSLFQCCCVNINNHHNLMFYCSRKSRKTIFELDSTPLLGRAITHCWQSRASHFHNSAIGRGANSFECRRANENLSWLFFYYLMRKSSFIVYVLMVGEKLNKQSFGEVSDKGKCLQPTLVIHSLLRCFVHCSNIAEPSCFVIK